MEYCLCAALLLLAAAALLGRRRSVSWLVGYWLVDFMVVLGCAAALFGAVPLQFVFLNSAAFWANAAAFVIVIALGLLLLPLPRVKKTPPQETTPKEGNAMLESMLLALNFLLALAAGLGGLGCLTAARAGLLPQNAWAWLVSYCLLWLAPVAVRQLFWALRVLKNPPAAPPTDLDTHYHRL